MTVAALFIDPDGPYPALGVDCWDASRGAQFYPGPYPVVAHPPCGPWGKLVRRCGPALMAQRWLAVNALHSVRMFGGVLEHPDGSRLWVEHDVPPPGGLPDAWGGWTLRIDQARWGHPCRKTTLFYIVGRFDLPPIPPPRKPTHVITSSLRKSDPRRLPDVPSDQTHITPPALAAWLVELAAGCRRRPEA